MIIGGNELMVPVNIRQSIFEGKEAMTTCSSLVPLPSLSCALLAFLFPLTGTFCLHVVSAPTCQECTNRPWHSWSHSAYTMTLLLQCLCHGPILSVFYVLREGDWTGLTLAQSLIWLASQAVIIRWPPLKEGYFLSFKNIITKEDNAIERLCTELHSIKLYK